MGVISAIAIPAVLNTLKDSKVKADVATAQSISKSITLAIVSANSDTATSNDIGAVAATKLSALSGNLKTELEKSYPGVTSMKTQNNATDFTVTITSVDPTYAGTVTFSDGTNTHSIDATGTDTITK